MKRNLMIMGACMTMGLSSCVWSESVEEVIAQTEIPQIVEQITESRSANGLVCMDGGDYVFTEIDWNKPKEDPLKDYVTDDDGYVAYLYDGTGGTIVRDGSGVGIRYRQSADDMFKDRFSYAAADVREPGTESPLVFHDAFAGVRLKITNRVSNLLLEVKDFKLVNIAREGLFMFPQEGGTARWTDLAPGGYTDIVTDSLSVCPGDSLLLPVEGALPVIPQSVKAWSTGGHPVFGGGTYLLLGCRISYTGEDTARGSSIWCGEDDSFAYAAIPVSFDAKMGETCTIEIELETGCPWYSLRNENPSKILQPITFSPSVDDWMDGSADINI